MLDHLLSGEKYEDIFRQGKVGTFLPQVEEASPAIAQLEVGDWVWIENNYAAIARTNIAWIGENVIKIGPDSFYGFGPANTEHTYSGWVSTLLDIARQTMPQLTESDIPGSRGVPNRKFIDAASVGQSTFDYRDRKARAK